MNKINPPYTYRSPSPAPPPRRQPKLFMKFMMVAGAIGIAVLGFHLLMPGKSSAQSQSQATQITAGQQQALSTMDTQINDVLSVNKGVDISVTVTDLRTGQSRSYGPAVSYEAASVAKLITAADLLHQTESGQQKLSETLEDGNTAGHDLRQMIVMSDNNAWQSLTDQLTLDDLGTYSQSIGINDYDLNNNTLQTGDIAMLLQKLYDGTLLNKTSTRLLLSYMKIANENGFITPAVPKDVTVYHKAGVLEDRIHDAAIIADPSNPVALVIFTNGHGAGNDGARTQAIQAITKAVLTAYNIK
jgi:beta-lactamase class A